ncbi:hypothetical protein [Amorphus sp. MBR-141]
MTIEMDPAEWQYRWRWAGGPWSEWQDGRAPDASQIFGEIETEERPVYTEAQVKAREAAAWEAGREASAGVADEHSTGGTNTYGHGRADAANAIRALDNPHKVP